MPKTIYHVDDEHGKPLCGADPKGAFLVDRERANRSDCPRCIAIARPPVSTLAPASTLDPPEPPMPAVAVVWTNEVRLSPSGPTPTGADPNTALQSARQLVLEIKASEDDTPGRRLANIFDVLDRLGVGGKLPTPWRQR